MSEADDEYVDYVESRLPQLRRAAYLLCGDWFAGDDLLQRTLTHVYADWARIRRAASIDAYVRKVLVHRFIDERRRPWARVRLVDSVPDRAVTDPDDAAGRLDVRAALLELPPRQRAVVVLRFLYDMSVEETAAALACSTGTVKSQTSAGLATLRRRLAHTHLS